MSSSTADSDCLSPDNVVSPMSPEQMVKEDRDSLSSMDAIEEFSEDEYFKPIKKLRMVPNPAPNPPKPLTSFLIKDILNHKTNHRRNTNVTDKGIVRPWDLESSAVPSRRPRSADEDSRSERSESDSPESPSVSNANTSPLDALFEMTSKAFEGLEANEKNSESSRDHLNLFSNRQQPKKKRKSRTAFTNHQIFELEKRFLYQKYLSPADRDEIAQSLGLTNAQVITWFQNRRAKLKRDMEELKKDVTAAKLTPLNHGVVVRENIEDLSLMKKEYYKKTN